MISQETFYKNLNQSLKESDIQFLWKPYRETVTQLILQEVSSLDHVMIVGAGGCHDFELETIAAHCSKLILSDIDQEAMVMALKRSKIPKDKVEIVVKDYTTLSTVKFFERLNQYLTSNKTEAFICKYIEDCFNVILSTKVKPTNTPDVVVVLPIYTQLVLPMFQSIINSKHINLNGSIDTIYQCYLTHSVKAIHFFNQTLAEYAKQGAKLLLFSDILEYQEGHSDFKQLQDMDQLALKALEETYVNTYGYGYGHYGMIQLGQLVDLDQSAYLCWHFSSFRKMIVSYVKHLPRTT